MRAWQHERHARQKRIFCLASRIIISVNGTFEACIVITIITVSIQRYLAVSTIQYIIL